MKVLVALFAFAHVAVAEPPVDQLRVSAAKQIIADAIIAKGGMQKLASLKALKIVASGSMTVAGRPVSVEVQRLFVVPDKLRVDAEISSIKVTIAVDGKQGWQIAPDANGRPALTDIAAADLSSIDAERWREPDFILLRASESRVDTLADEKMKKHADSSLDGRPHAIVKLRSPVGTTVLLYVDRATKLLSRMVYDEAGVVTTEDYYDYRDVKNVKIAHRRRSDSGSRVTTLELKSVEANPKIDPSVFRKPASR